MLIKYRILRGLCCPYSTSTYWLRSVTSYQYVVLHCGLWNLYGRRFCDTVPRNLSPLPRAAKAWHRQGRQKHYKTKSSYNPPKQPSTCTTHRRPQGVNAITENFNLTGFQCLFSVGCVGGSREHGVCCHVVNIPPQWLSLYCSHATTFTLYTQPILPCVIVTVKSIEQMTAHLKPCADVQPVERACALHRHTSDEMIRPKPRKYQTACAVHTTSLVNREHAAKRFTDHG